MKENFSNRVQNILKYAKEEAIRLGHSYVGSEHLLLGLLKEDSGLSYKILDIYAVYSSRNNLLYQTSNTPQKHQ